MGKYLQKGQVFSRLTVLEVDLDSKMKDGKAVSPSKWKYKCKCSCENHTILSVRKDALLNGSSKSCGCLIKETNTFIHKKTNPIEVVGDITKIFFFNQDNIYTIVDSEDYSFVKDICWYLSTYGYAVGGRKKMHRIINNTPEGMYTDHINHNKLDNRKQNLRTCTPQQNNMNNAINPNNTSGVTGVRWRKDMGKWNAFISVNKKDVSLGHFKNKEDAIRARLDAEIKYFGEFAPSICRKGEK